MDIKVIANYFDSSAYDALHAHLYDVFVHNQS